jgi:hypothetical protein
MRRDHHPAHAIFGMASERVGDSPQDARKGRPAEAPTRPDRWHPRHRHDVRPRELPIGGSSSTVAVATRQGSTQGAVSGGPLLSGETSSRCHCGRRQHNAAIPRATGPRAQLVRQRTRAENERRGPLGGGADETRPQVPRAWRLETGWPATDGRARSYSAMRYRRELRRRSHLPRARERSLTFRRLRVT